MMKSIINQGNNCLDDWKNGYDLVNIIADSMLEGVVFDDDTTPVTPSDPSNPETPSDGNDKEPVTEIPDGGKATGVPAAPSIEQTKWNGESSFGIRMNIWWGQNGTLAELIENEKTVESVILTDNSPSAQSYTFNVTGKANGTYEYQVKISNKFGSTLSNTVKYTVTQGSSSQEPGNTEPETPGNDNPSEEEPYIPPSIEELERRLRERSTEDEETILKRVAKAKREMKDTAIYEHIVCNDDLDTAVKEVRQIILDEMNKVE